jgi:predicted LPLAT superfamily acyltransferase
MVMIEPGAKASARPRNPGPSWGYGFLRLCDRFVPEFLFKPLRGLGTAIAVALMRDQRRHSRDYLSAALRRPPTLLDVFRHFFAFEESLMTRLRLANGRKIPCVFDPSASAFQAWLSGGGPILLGTFHFGASDMLGFQIGCDKKKRIHIIRSRVGNSNDTDWLAEAGGGCVQFIWANDASEFIFALKDAAESGEAIAMQCDRIENALHTDVFEFLGAPRRFPFTIYRLALILERAVILTVGVPEAPGRSRLYGSPRFERIAGESRQQALERAKGHFQGFLQSVERLLRDHPYLWFNFIPLNPAVDREAGRSIVS